MAKYLLFFYLILFHAGLKSQTLSNLRIKNISLAQEIVVEDSLTIIPSSIQVTCSSCDTFVVDSLWVDNNRIKVYTSNKNTGALNITYRVFSENMLTKQSHFDSSLIAYTYNRDYIGFDIGSREKISNLDLEGLDYDGSFLRGLSFGNNQSLFLNSSFNLQIAGKINDDTEILAALTDENIPLQPQGNTQQLNEFDKIFIQVKNRGKTLTAGDYELGNGSGHFLKYFKRLKGGSLEFKNRLNDQYESSTQISAAISKGKFARYTLETQEGNQGPYKLQGAEGERFIIILAGTERIYLDGRLLDRGIEEDYIIDYNQAELRFTSNQLITKDRRIIVEFDYTFDIYNRGFYAVNSTIKSKKGYIGFQVYSEQDSKNPTAQFTFTEEQLSVLRAAGDDPNQSISSSVRPFLAENNFNPVTYRLADTVVNTSLRSILLYSVDTRFDLFTASFSFVGQGNGHYIPADPAINGLVFQWIAPNGNGTLNGSYEALTNLITPTKKQVITLNASYSLSEDTKVKGEFSLSNNDLNKISDIDDDDNTDIAFYGEVAKSISLSNKGKWKGHLGGTYEYAGANYVTVKTFRNQEFNRNWNIGDLSQISASDHLSALNLGLSNEATFDATYGLKSYVRENLYNGLNQNWLVRNSFDDFISILKGDWLTSTAGEEKSSYVRPSIELTKKLKSSGLLLHFNNDFERNIITKNDTINRLSFQFYEQKTSIGSSNKNKFNWELSHGYRSDQLPLNGDLNTASKAHEIAVKGQLTKSTNRLLFNVHYRNLSISPAFKEEIQSQNTYLTKIEHQIKLLNKGVTMTNVYELGSGQEARKDVIFIETLEEGQGQYIHRELNNDDIKQNFEFFLAPFSNQGNFNRILLGSTDFIRTNNVNFNQSIVIDFKKIIKNKIKSNFLKKIIINSNLLSSKKNEATDQEFVYNPFTQNLDQEVIISAENRWKSTLFINRANPKYQIQYSFTSRQNKNLFTTGFESRSNKSHILTSRYNIGKFWSAELTLESETRNSTNEIFSERDFDISSIRINPQFTYLASRSIRWRSTMSFENTENNPGREEASIYGFTSNIQLRKSTKSSIEIELLYDRIDVRGELNPSIELDFLRGLSEGNNFQWMATISKTLAKNLRLNFSYDGRKIGDGRIVHTGRAQVGATF